MSRSVRTVGAAVAIALIWSSAASAHTATSVAKEVRDATTGGSFAATATASPGDTLEYRVSVANGSKGGSVRGVVVTDTLQAKQTFLDCSDGCTTSGSPAVVSWNVGTIAAGQTAQRTVRVVLDSSFPTGTTQVDNSASVIDKQEPAHSSNTTTTTVTVSPPPTPSLTKEVRDVFSAGGFAPSIAPINPGDTLEYRLTYQSLGAVQPGQTVNVTVQVVLDATFPSGTTTINNVPVFAANGHPGVSGQGTTVTVTAP